MSFITVRIEQGEPACVIEIPGEGMPLQNFDFYSPDLRFTVVRFGREHVYIDYASGDTMILSGYEIMIRQRDENG